MEYKRAVTALPPIIMVLAGVVSSAGIFTTGGSGSYSIETVRGDSVTVYGKGLYQHMSTEVAPQGIAQD